MVEDDSLRMLQQLDELYFLADKNLSADPVERDLEVEADLKAETEVEVESATVSPITAPEFEFPDVIESPVFPVDAPVDAPVDIPTVPIVPSDSYEMLRQNIELHRLRMNNELELNRKVREAIQEMKNNIFANQARSIEIFKSQMESLKELGFSIS
jgi:hypothetical protein